MNRFGSAIVTAAALSMSTGAGHALSCERESHLKSLNGDTPITVTFKAIGENDETQFKIYWLDYAGDRVLYNHIFAGQTYTQQTFLTHPWLITAPEPGGGEVCVTIRIPEQDNIVIELR